MSRALRIAVASGLLLFGLVELMRFLALVAAPGLHTALVHGVLAALAGLAGVALWRRLAWAPVAIVALGCALAAVFVIDAIVLGIRPWLYALLGAVAAVLVALALAVWAKQEARSDPVR